MLKTGAGWEVVAATLFGWDRLPRLCSELASMNFARLLVNERQEADFLPCLWARMYDHGVDEHSVTGLRVVVRNLTDKVACELLAAWVAEHASPRARDQ
jgi:hypothetical protein